MTSSGKRKYKARPESWGALRKLPSGRYQASYLHEGERYNAPHTFDAMGDARAWLASVRSDIQRGRWRDPRSAQAETFENYAAVWLSQRVSVKGEPLRPRTRTEYTRQLSRGLSEFGSDDIQKITPARVRAWHSGRLTEAGATAAGREAALLRAILGTAVTDGIIDRNPVDSKLTRSSSGRSHRPPTLEELSVIVDHFAENEPRLRLAVLLAAYGGLRMSEWRALRRRDLTIDGDRVIVAVTRQAQRVTGVGWITGPPKSAEGLRVVPLPAALGGDVREHLASHVGRFPDDLLFAPLRRSEFLDDSQFNAAWNAAREAAGVRVRHGDGWVSVVREHDLRHFALSFYAATGATLAELKARAGHSTNQAAMIYQHAVVDRAAELADAMPLLPVAPKRVVQLNSTTAPDGTAAAGPI